MDRSKSSSTSRPRGICLPTSPRVVLRPPRQRRLRMFLHPLIHPLLRMTSYRPPTPVPRLLLLCHLPCRPRRHRLRIQRHLRPRSLKRRHRSSVLAPERWISLTRRRFHPHRLTVRRAQCLPRAPALLRLPAWTTHRAPLRLHRRGHRSVRRPTLRKARPRVRARARVRARSLVIVRKR